MSLIGKNKDGSLGGTTEYRNILLCVYVLVTGSMHTGSTPFHRKCSVHRKSILCD